MARQQFDREVPKANGGDDNGGDSNGDGKNGGNGTERENGDPAPPKAKRFHGTVELGPTRVGRDAGLIAEEVIAHLAGLSGGTVKVTLEIEAELPEGTPEQVVRIVTENSRTLKFTSQGFEEE